MSLYRPEEVHVLVEEYEALRELKAKPWIHIRLLDLERAVRRMPKTLREVIVLHGMLGLPQRAVSEFIGAGQSTISRRYLRGVDWILTHLNGGSN